MRREGTGPLPNERNCPCSGRSRGCRQGSIAFRWSKTNILGTLCSGGGQATLKVKSILRPFQVGDKNSNVRYDCECFLDAGVKRCTNLWNKLLFSTTSRTYVGFVRSLNACPFLTIDSFPGIPGISSISTGTITACVSGAIGGKLLAADVSEALASGTTRVDDSTVDGARADIVETKSKSFKTSNPILSMKEGVMLRRPMPRDERAGCIDIPERRRQAELRVDVLSGLMGMDSLVDGILGWREECIERDDPATELWKGDTWLRVEVKDLLENAVRALRDG